MGESTLEWAKRQKVSASQTSRTNAVCEDCGRKWTATLTEVPVTIFIKDLDEYYKKLSKNLLEAVEPEMVLCVFRPSDRDVTDSEVTLSVVAPRQDSPYHWRINHKFSGPAAASGCQITIWKADQSSASISHEVCIEPDIVTIKQEIKEEMKEEDELMVEEVDFDPLARHRIDDPDDPDPDWTNSDTDTITGVNDSLSTTILAAKGSTEVRKRFGKTSEEDILAIKDKRFEKNTIKNTVWGVKIFKDWLQENDLDIAFESLIPKELDTLLARFYVELRKADGKYYSKTSTTCIRAAIQRHLEAQPWNVTYCILKDSAFYHSNSVLKGMMKDLTKMGNSVVSHHRKIDQRDMLKLIQSGVVGPHNPRALLNMVWLSCALHFGGNMKEPYRLMTKDTFRRHTDEDGCEFYVYSGNPSRVRMYARPGDPLCPVAAMDKYLSLLHPEQNCLWQRPNYKLNAFNDDAYWYINVPQGHNTLSNMMKNMSKDARLSQIYTNHSIKATVCKILGDAKFDRSDIISQTGHKDTRSLDTYMGNSTASLKRTLSDTLSGLTTCQTTYESKNEKEHQEQLNDSTTCSVPQNENNSESLDSPLTVVLDIKEDSILVCGTDSLGMKEQAYESNMPN